MKNKYQILSLVTVLLASTLRTLHADDKRSIVLVSVDKVALSSALGFGNGRKIFIDSSGVLTLVAATRTDQEASGLLFYQTKPADGFQPIKRQPFDFPAFVGNGSEQVSPTIHGTSDGWLHAVWVGSQNMANSVIPLGHQVRYARFKSNSLELFEATEPFHVDGYRDALRQAMRQQLSWQEQPNGVTTEDGTFHLVWEARDAKRMAPNNIPLSGIAYATRSASGAWSLSGTIQTPPYLKIESPFDLQARPWIVAVSPNLLYVFCSRYWQRGWRNVYGKIENGKFSGWNDVSSSSEDQRNVNAAIDVNGGLHVVWRENKGELASVIYYSSLGPDGKWSDRDQLSQDSRFASRPQISVDGDTVRVIWISWADGFSNSDDRINNSFPNDEGTVEGSLTFANKKKGDLHFSSPQPITGGTGSYPTWAHNDTYGKMPPIGAYTVGWSCSPGSCVDLYIGYVGVQK